MTILSYKFYMSNVVDDENVLHAVEKVRDSIRDSKFAGRAFACGPTFTQYEALLDLEAEVFSCLELYFWCSWVFAWIGMGFRIGSVQHLSTALMIMEVWGIMMYTVKLNVFSVCAFLLTSSLAPVFTTHVAVAFKANTHLPPAERLSVAMSVALPANLQGALCILCASLMIVMSQSHMLVQSFGETLVLVVLFGIYHGCFVTPLFLAVIAQNETVPCEAKQSECVGPAVERPVLQGGPNLLESSSPDKVGLSK